jgi:NitT/TauT family transport system substrate-binding protein
MTKTRALAGAFALALGLGVAVERVRAAAPPQPVQLVIGYQPYYAGAWGALVVKERELWKKYLPPGSTIDWEVGLQGSVITNNMLAGKYQVGYVGDMPGIVATTKRAQGDIRIVMMTSYSEQMCNNLLVRPDAPAFKTPHEAARWLNGKNVAIPRGTCSDRFAREVFKRENVTPGTVENEGLEAVLANLRAGKLDAAFLWEPNASHVGEIVGNKSARLAATGSDWGFFDGGEIIVNKTLLDQRPDVVTGLLKAEIEAEQFITSNYPANACALVDYAEKNTTGYEKKELWYALFGRPEFAGANEKGVRWDPHIVFDPPVRSFLSDASTFLLDNKVIAEQMPADAIVDAPLRAAMGSLHVSRPLGPVKVHPATQYPCG